MIHILRMPTRHHNQTSTSSSFGTVTRSNRQRESQKTKISTVKMKKLTKNCPMLPFYASISTRKDDWPKIKSCSFSAESQIFSREKEIFYKYQHQWLVWLFSVPVDLWLNACSLRRYPWTILWPRTLYDFRSEFILTPRYLYWCSSSLVATHSRRTIYFWETLWIEDTSASRLLYRTTLQMVLT